MIFRVTRLLFYYLRSTLFLSRVRLLLILCSAAPAREVNTFWPGIIILARDDVSKADTLKPNTVDDR